MLKLSMLNKEHSDLICTPMFSFNMKKPRTKLFSSISKFFKDENFENVKNNKTKNISPFKLGNFYEPEQTKDLNHHLMTEISVKMRIPYNFPSFEEN